MRQSLGYIYRMPGRSTWMMKYFQDGRPIRKTTGTDDEKAAQAALNAATTDAGRGIPTDGQGRQVDIRRRRHRPRNRLCEQPVRFAGRREGPDQEPPHAVLRRQETEPRSRRRSSTPTSKTRAARKHAATPPSTASSALLKRMFTLAHRAGLIVARPYIPKLDEHNVRKGFFEDDAFAGVVPAPDAGDCGCREFRVHHRAGEPTARSCRWNGARWTARAARSRSTRTRPRTTSRACSR